MAYIDYTRSVFREVSTFYLFGEDAVALPAGVFVSWCEDDERVCLNGVKDSVFLGLLLESKPVFGHPQGATMEYTVATNARVATTMYNADVPEWGTQPFGAHVVVDGMLSTKVCAPVGVVEDAVLVVKEGPGPGTPYLIVDFNCAVNIPMSFYEGCCWTEIAEGAESHDFPEPSPANASLGRPK